MAEESVRFEVNGRAVDARVAKGRTLLRFLRDELRLTGTKDGCSQGDCGACTVIVDGHAVRSCQTKLSAMAGKQVETIEGMSSEGHLHCGGTLIHPPFPLAANYTNLKFRRAPHEDFGPEMVANPVQNISG